MEVVQFERTIRQKRIDIGSRESGCFGELFDAGTGHKRRHRQRLNGTVLSAVGTKQYQDLINLKKKRMNVRKNMELYCWIQM